MRKICIVGLFLLALPSLSFAATNYDPQSVGAGNPELHIKPDGSVVLRSARVDQIAGTTLYLGIVWGAVPMRFTMKTDSRTTLTKRFGGSALIPQIRIGDYIDVEGEFFVGSDFFGVNALRVKDWSLQEEAGAFSGVIAEVLSDERFTLLTPSKQTISVRLSTTSAVSISKGAVTIPFGRLRKGDAIPLISGVYDHAQNRLTADKILIYQAKSEFTPRNFEGTLKRVDAGAAPEDTSSAKLVVAVGGVEYTVLVGPTTEVLSKNRKKVVLGRFVVGDTIRFYGAVKEEDKILRDELIVEAKVIRNLNL
ncbi:MAG: hypothetical protein A2849_02700 [Candidatus Taylorbacteria bacterium RIFCSPHIGHO2_01_FULL_51_15]|uniref:DUF5666 domain-containing protein n=1 Tax=Candidatus Taylorbacteria bacterium RIFCSPHIGHO2_01_FULL_51_15 TaxID=1802304 RepID=A0A1G2MD42_9BACT|nr:MAG: hypothetical protein A2849_02700 [Candidatus Taylorbacteria bacterium RIFCSPHIGHO2_01_FULL_51_15]